MSQNKNPPNENGVPAPRHALRLRFTASAAITIVMLVTLFICISQTVSSQQTLPNKNATKKSEPPLQLLDLTGKAQTPLDQLGKNATVCFFILPDCPISNSYAPEIGRICTEYAPKKIASFIVHVDPEVTAEEAKKHTAEFKLPGVVLLDPTHALVRQAGVTIAPEVAVFSADGKVVYRGRIDDWYVAVGKRRPAATQHDLRNALDAIVDGKEVAVPTTEALGCYLPKPKISPK